MSYARFDKKAPWIVDRLMADFDLTVEQACAVVGNIGHECGGFTLMQEQKPTVKGSLGGYGWCQWTGPRRKTFFAWCKKHGLSVDSDEGNYGYLVQELRSSEAKAIPAVKRKSNLRDMVVAFELAFERAGVKHYDSRLIYAKRALDLCRKRKPVEEPPPAPEPLPPPPDVEPTPVPAPEAPAETRKPWWRRALEWFTGAGGFSVFAYLTDPQVVLALGAVGLVAFCIYWFLIRKKRR